MGSKQLLGTGFDGVKYYLENASWDCDWYWGFGYITSKDSHQHADGHFFADNEKYSTDGNIFTGNFFVKKTFSIEQGWILRELMATFYQLKSQAELVGRGGMHVTKNPLQPLLLDLAEAERINRVLIPTIIENINIILKAGK